MSKMPFIPPVSIACPRYLSGSGLTGKQRPTSHYSSSATALTKINAKVQAEEGSSVKERLTLNLKELGKRTQPRSKGVSGLGLHGKCMEDPWLPSPKVFSDGITTTTSDDSTPKTQQRKPTSGDSTLKSGPEESKSRLTRQEDSCFMLTLPPEAVRLLLRRSNEKQLLAARSAGGGNGTTSNTADARRKQENLSKGHQPVAQHGTQRGRAANKNMSDGLVSADISSLVKISLLNEHYKYDDVEYEEEDEYGVDEQVVLKCTEWLRGLENAPVTVGNRMNKSAASVKGF